jgi:hypothetical protein
MPLHPREVLAIEDRLTRPSSWVTSFPLTQDSLEVGDRDFNQMVTQLHQLTGPITSSCDRYVQYLLAGGATHRFLTNTGRDYSLERAGFFTHHSPTFPTDDPPFPPKGPVRSQVIQNLTHVPRFKFKETYDCHVVF